ncbi:hypothetical protein ACOMHN_043137 [Nucella lapillus]
MPQGSLEPPPLAEGGPGQPAAGPWGGGSGQGDCVAAYIGTSTEGGSRMAASKAASLTRSSLTWVGILLSAILIALAIAVAGIVIRRRRWKKSRPSHSREVGGDSRMIVMPEVPAAISSQYERKASTVSEDSQDSASVVDAACLLRDVVAPHLAFFVPVLEIVLQRFVSIDGERIQSPALHRDHVMVGVRTFVGLAGEGGA